jgi:hypothetical protein
MSRNSSRETLCINAVAWAGTLSVVGLVVLDVAQHSLSWTSGAIGYIFAAVLLGQMFLSGRGLNFGSLLLAGVAGAFPFWSQPASSWFGELMVGLVGNAETWLAGMVGMLVLPVFMVLCSAFVGLMLSAATGSGAVGVQSLLAGVVAGVVSLVPGDPTMILGAAGALWCSILFLSLSKWARNYLSRTSRGAEIVCLGQDGPLASLVRGSAQGPRRERSDAA